MQRLDEILNGKIVGQLIEMTDDDCLRIEKETINYLMRCNLDDFSISCEEIRTAFREVIRGLK